MSALYLPQQREDLSDRERTILQAIVQLFILHASPVGSRVVSKFLEREMKLSPATIRNIMSDLEELGYIAHPHTSAGRMPTDKGYRFYVDTLMDVEHLPHQDTAILGELVHRPKELLFRDASKILSSLSHHLAVVRIPRFGDVVVRHVEILQLSSERLLVVLSLESDIVQTITMETASMPASGTVDEVKRLINERLVGRPLRMLSEIFPEAQRDDHGSTPSLVRLFVEHVERLGNVGTGTSVHVAGAQQLLTLPEFEDPDRMRSVIELIENEDVIIHLVDSAAQDGLNVRIGNELENEQFTDYSLVTTTYRVGSATGSVSLIGPKRMQYSRMMSLVQMVSNVLNTSFDTSH